MSDQLRDDHLLVEVGRTNTKPSKQRRRVTITELHDHGRITLVFSPKGRDVIISVEGVEFNMSFSVLRKLADKGMWNMTDALIELGWTPPREEGAA